MRGIGKGERGRKNAAVFSEGERTDGRTNRRAAAAAARRSYAVTLQCRRVVTVQEGSPEAAALLLLPQLPSWTQTCVADRHTDTDACLKLTDEIEVSLSIEI